MFRHILMSNIVFSVGQPVRGIGIYLLLTTLEERNTKTEI
jgi:hypothetical protein